MIIRTEIDPELDPQFYKACTESLTMCHDEIMGGKGHGALMECMKSQFYSHRYYQQASVFSSRQLMATLLILFIFDTFVL